MQMAQTRYKSYADKHRRGLEFEFIDHVFFEVSPIRGVIHFGQKRGKLSPSFIGPFKILERVGKVAYKFDLFIGLPNNLWPKKLLVFDFSLT